MTPSNVVDFLGLKIKGTMLTFKGMAVCSIVLLVDLLINGGIQTIF